jgi:hypothetical protein
MTEIVLVFIGLFIGAIIVGVGIFLFFLVSAIRALKTAVDTLNATIEPLAKDPVFRSMGAGIRAMAYNARDLIDGMKAVSKTMEIFQTFAFGGVNKGRAATPPPADETAKPGESGFEGYDDAEAAAREAAELARQAGIETDPNRVEAPDPEKINVG